MGRSERGHSVSELSVVPSHWSPESQIGFTSLAPLKSMLNGVEHIQLVAIILSALLQCAHAEI